VIDGVDVDRTLVGLVADVEKAVLDKVVRIAQVDRRDRRGIERLGVVLNRIVVEELRREAVERGAQDDSEDRGQQQNATEHPASHVRTPH
jgi:hypothetical protein